jgi:hypothetical protein
MIYSHFYNNLKVGLILLGLCHQINKKFEFLNAI